MILLSADGARSEGGRACTATGEQGCHAYGDRQCGAVEHRLDPGGYPAQCQTGYAGRDEQQAQHGARDVVPAGLHRARAQEHGGEGGEHHPGAAVGGRAAHSCQVEGACQSGDQPGHGEGGEDQPVGADADEHRGPAVGSHGVQPTTVRSVSEQPPEDQQHYGDRVGDEVETREPLRGQLGQPGGAGRSDLLPIRRPLHDPAEECRHRQRGDERAGAQPHHQ